MAQPLPPPQSGDDREDRAALIAAAVTAVFAAAEAALVASIASAVRRALTSLASVIGRRAAPSPIAPVTSQAIARSLERQAAGILATAEQRAARIVAESVPGPVPEAVTQALEHASEHAFGEIASVYRQVVDAAIAETRGGIPYSSLSLSRIQAAQRALDDLLGRGITGFTDRAGRKWDLASYVEMATRTAVSNAYDDLHLGALSRAGIDVVLVGTHSTEGSCPRCLPFQGHLLSLTGETTGSVTVRDITGAVHRQTVMATLAEAKAAGLRHPACRCTLTGWHDGINLAEAEMFATPRARSEAEYKASQKTRALERRVRAAGRRSQLAITPQARTQARRDLATARAASAAHRAGHGVRQTQVGVRRREHPYRAH